MIRFLFGAVMVLLVFLGCRASLDKPLQLLDGQGPVYPSALKKSRVEGYVVIKYDVNIKGQVENAAIIESVPFGMFEASALKTVYSWQFSPVMKQGIPQATVGLTSRVSFRLAVDRDDR